MESSAPTVSSVTAEPESEVKARTGGAALVECLSAHGIPLWTCVPGESFLPVLDALWEAGIGVINTRHEAAAANMAEAAGKLTGRAAVCLVTRGPGASHASIGLHTAYQDGTPLILLVGQVDRELLGRDAFQEMEYERVFGSSAKAVLTVDDADRIPELVAQAMHVAHSGRPGPVVLVVPEDVQYDRTAAPVRIAPPAAAPPLTEADRDALLARLSRARRPVLIVGGPGWSQSVGDDVTAFAERNQIPMAAAFRWQDAVDNASASYVGYLGLGGSRELRANVTADADLIVALGPRLDDPTTDGYRLDAAAMRTVLVSQAPGDLGRPPAPAPALAIHASLESVAAALREARAAAARPTAAPGARSSEAPGPVPRAGRPTTSRSTPRPSSRTCARRCRRTRSSPTGPATTRSGCSGSSSSAGSAPSSPPGTGRWGTGCRPAWPRPPCTPTGRWSPSPATAAS